MNDSNKTVKTGQKELKEVKTSDEKVRYNVKITEERARFSGDKLKKGDAGKVKATVQKLKKDGEKWVNDGSEEKDKEIDVTYTGGIMWDGLELKKIDSLEVKEAKSFGGSFQIAFYLTMGAIALIIVGLIIWWVMASRKEDKEEGDL